MNCPRCSGKAGRFLKKEFNKSQTVLAKKEKPLEYNPSVKFPNTSKSPDPYYD